MALTGVLSTRAGRLALVALETAGFTACAGYQHYKPAAIPPSWPAALITRRRFDDPGLARFLESHGAPPTASGWSSRQLALAALYYRTDLDVRRATVAVVQSAETTAGARPPTSVQATVERGSRVEEGKSSPWTVSLAAGVTLETGGKRAARIDRAHAATLGASLRLQSAAWQVASETRHAASTAVAASRDAEASAAIVAEARALVTRMRARFAEGQISAADVARSQADLQSGVVDEHDALRASTVARVALSRAVGVPFAQIERLPLRADARSDCSALLALGQDSLVTLALNQRYELGAALADYAVADADLRLAIAKQYPDLTIAPGLAWDQGITRWILTAALQSIPAARNRGPIAEATARRALQVANAEVAQQVVIASVDSAVASCRSVIDGLVAADSLVGDTEHQLDLAEAAYRRGETGATEVSLARLAVVRARRTHTQARARHAAAGVSLEDALGAWVDAPAIRWPDVSAPSGAPLSAPVRP